LTPLYYSLVGREGGLPECEHFRAGSVFSYLVDARTYLERWVGEFEEWRKIKMKWDLLVGEYVDLAIIPSICLFLDLLFSSLR
jgi:hypothetical protein